MSLKLTKFSVVLTLFFSFLFVLTACEPNNGSRGDLYSSDIVIEVLHSDKEKGISAATLTLEDDDGNIQTAVPAETTGIYEFQNIELLEGEEYDININRTGYEDEIITILAEGSEIIRTDSDAVKLTEADNADNELIDKQGGELQLSDGTKLEISKGAVDKYADLTIESIEDNGDSGIESIEDNGDSGIYETQQYTTLSNIESFNKKVKFIYPLPDNAPSEPERYQVNLVNEDTGTVLPQENENSHWEINTEEDKLIYTTDSFSLPENGEENSGEIQAQNREFSRSILRIDYNPEQPDDEVKITGIPYSYQDNADYCWAAAYQMLTESYMNRESTEAIWHIISRFGKDDDDWGIWGSLSNVESRFFPETKKLFKDRTGTAPERRWWNWTLSLEDEEDSFVGYLKDQLSNEKPVFLATDNHAVVLVGYDVSGSEIKFYVQDPNGKGSPVELETKEEMGVEDNMVTVVPAESVNNQRSQIGLDLLDNSLMFTGDENMKFMWDHDKSEGYSIVNDEGEEKLISSELKHLDLRGDIVMVGNTSGETKELILNIEIEPANYKQEKFSRDVPFEIENNKHATMPKLIENNDELKVSAEEFVVPSENPEEYRLILSLKEDGKIINRRKIEFTLDAYEEEPPEGMVNVPAGTTSEANGNITLEEDIYMDKYEVTQAEFESVMDFNPSEFSGSDHPVDTVTWYDAVKYANKLSEQEGLEKYYDITSEEYWGQNIVDADVKENPEANGYRLPTEDEWEYAARGGKGGASTTYAGSDDPDKVAWYRENAGDKTHSVGEKQANELGIYDMSGNVWEWTNTPDGSNFVERGGAWLQDADLCEVIGFLTNSPGNRITRDGFRLIRRP